MGNKKKGFTYRKRIFAYFMAISIVPLLILGFYSYHSAAMAVRKNIRQSNETALLQVENKAENVLDAVRQSLLSLASSSLAGEIVNQKYDDIPYPKIRDFIDEIIGDEVYINYVSGYSFINYKNGWMLSNKGMIPVDKANNVQWLRELSADRRKMFWINHAEKVDSRELIQSEYANDNYLTFVVKVPTYAEFSNAAFIFNIDRSSFEGMLKKSLANGALVVFDDNGKLVCSENQAVAAYYEQHPDELKRPDVRSIHTKEGTFDIVKKQAAISGWTFIAGYDPALADGQLKQIPITMAGIILMVLIVSGLISGFSTIHVYQPVKNLVTQISSIVPASGQKEAGSDEFLLINQGIHTLAGHNEELQNMIDRQKNQLAELFAYRLIRGRLNGAEIRQTKERLKITFLPNLCVVSVIFCKKTDREREQMEQDVLNLDQLKRMPEEIKNILLFPPFIHTRAIVMIIDGETRERVEQKILALRNCLSVFADEGCSGYVDMGVSRIFPEATGFARAYNESIEALKINEYYDRDEDTEGMSMEDSSVTYYGDLAGQRSGKSGYNLVLDTEVKKAVDESDQVRAFSIADEFLRDLTKSGVVLYEQHYYLHRFLLAILSVPADAGIPIHDIFPEGEDNLFGRFNQLYDYQSIGKFYKTNVIVPVITRMNQFRKSSSEVVFQKIMDLIREYQGDLSLTECAEKLGYHPSYIWRVLKNTKDITFTDYIAKQKLELAKGMLVDTDLPVTEIANRLSYSNAQNFIRLFKKHMKITPGQFRKQNKGESLER
ncbi:helix-turn-helix domain-containing protein [Lacrimispora sp.]|uniref:helix-turn-helix domain-containing protein n=1 Tax=Lacrimispora sp. TaxID=2719234 RepID=UPI0039940E99